MKAKHTPAPWKTGKPNIPNKMDIGIWGNPSDEQYVICDMCDDGYDDDAQRANARLIASAPELLEALKAEEAHQQAMRNFESISDHLDDRILGFRNEVDRTRHVANRLRKEAIAKAEGA